MDFRVFWRGVTYFDAFSRERSNKREFYFTIKRFLIVNSHIIVNKPYWIRLSQNGKYFKPYKAFARKRGVKKPDYYFHIPKRMIDKGEIEINQKYHVEVGLFKNVDGNAF